jgi:hypothetical protein
MLLQDIAQVLVQFPAVESLRQLAGARRRVVRQLRAGSSLPAFTGPQSA